MRYIIPIVCLTFLLAVSCCKEVVLPIQVDDEGVIVSVPFQWRYSLHESGQYHENGIFKSSIIYDKNIAIPTTGKDGFQFMSMINSSNGKLEWKWNDVYPGSLGSLDFSQQYIYNNLITWQDFSISLPISYCVNLENGSTHWRIKREKLFYVRLYPFFDTKYFTTSEIDREDGYNETAAYIGDIETGELTEFLRANYSCGYASPFTENGWVGGIVYMNQIPSNDSLLLVTYAEPLPEWQIKSFIGLYNTETETWIYERKQLAPAHWNNSVFSTIINNDRYYANVGKSIVCHDITTGERIWGREFDQDFFFSGFIIEDGMLLANCEDTYLYRINPELGNIEWRIKSAGTCSRMSYLNGVVYYVGGSTGYLHAVDTETGLKTVWRIDASKLGENGGSFTTNAVYCIPGENGEKGRVVALSGRYAYCFEAYR
ncbi:MAG TPA: PQQ-binding-like beta-propeller repeat protein [Tenuifilaceae bacterium]|nr:PQQ-binding-like beta-propeller repeat protein [Tenuifilaceae bacterium]